MCCNPNSYDESNPLLGVVLAGGQSSRMGADKGLIKKNDHEWFKVAVDHLEGFGIPVVVSINPSQEEEYKKYFQQEYLITDKIGLKGPLEGILSVHDRFPTYDLIVIAADLPDLTFETIRELVEVYHDGCGEHDFFVYSINNEPEPLVGVYTTEGLGKIFSLHLSGQLEKSSMKYVLEVGNTYSVELSATKLAEFKNYNFKEDLI